MLSPTPAMCETGSAGADAEATGCRTGAIDELPRALAELGDDSARCALVVTAPDWEDGVEMCVIQPVLTWT
jgi:hypothetical protein